ncbi:hypothetical protein CHS0354_027415 [Potamilus streckersoni]|uniref:Flagellar biosynthetic protein FliR n=1 Tax=Potamilus streckersoni TaxID=2493646 RepID=A0AAE0W0T7_9BIVA|nr:hypothetical protein CHS0354_027415 [Potamilus streckersoni]
MTDLFSLDFNRPDSYGIILLAVKEILFGIFLGLIPHILFAAVELAGNIIAFMMGLSIANVFDPSTNSQTQVISGFKNALMIMLFLALNAHHVIFEAILASFRAVPVTTLTIPDTLYENTVRYFADIFFIALRLSYPIIAVTMLTNFVFGMLGKSIPQMNVFVVGAPLGILIGLLYMALGMPGNG